jgi:hypothetical protein
MAQLSGPSSMTFNIRHVKVESRSVGGLVNNVRVRTHSKPTPNTPDAAKKKTGDRNPELMMDDLPIPLHGQRTVRG